MSEMTRRDQVARTAVTAAALTAAMTLAGCASLIGSGDDAVAVEDTAVAPSLTVPVQTTGTTAAAAPATDTAAAGGTASGAIANLPAGWNVIVGTKASLGAPVGWIDMRPLVTDPAARAAFEQSIKDQSTSAAIDAIAPELLDTLDVMAMDGETAVTEFATTVNVIVDTTGLVKDLETMDAIIESQLAVAGAQLSGTNRSTIGGIETLVVDYSIPGPGGVTATGRQYHQAINNSMMTATFTALPGEVDYALWDQMASTVTVNV